MDLISVNSVPEKSDDVIVEVKDSKMTKPKKKYTACASVTEELRQNGTLSKEDERLYTWMEKQFRQMAGPEGTLDKEAFRAALQTKSFFTDRLFELFDNDNSGSISLAELLRVIHKLTKGTPTEKLHFLFRIYDADSNGTIDREDLSTVLRSCMQESNLNLSEENLEALTDALFMDADADQSGSISFEKLKQQLEKHPDIMANLTISTAQWLKPPKEQKKKFALPRKLTWTYIRNNLVKVIFTIIYIVINIGLFLLNGYLYWDTNWYIRIARGGGMCLNFNCTFVLVLMLRKTLTLLRNTPLVKILPFDHSVMFHKMAGYAIVFFTIVHTVAHLGNAIVYLTEDLDMPLWEILLTLHAGVGWFYGFSPLSGVILAVILVVMFVCSREFVRRSGYFEIFYWTHKLYIPFFVLTILHCDNFWKWIIGPGIIFILEMILKLKWIQRGGSMNIIAVHLLPSGVTQLTISRPSGFNYKPGDYIFLNIPVIAKYEWHPFTISSAPEMPDAFTIHVRSAGHWTNLLYSYFETMSPTPEDMENGEIYQKARMMRRGTSAKDFEHRRRNTKARKINASQKRRIKHIKVNVPVNVDGPYGTPSRHIFEAEHAVLIGSGIGVTPFASILQSIMYKIQAAEVECPKCLHKFCVDVPKSVMNLKTVDFVWVNRDQRNFEWFLSLLTRLEREQARDTGLDRRLVMHMYMTSAHSRSDMKGIGLQMALDLIHEHEQTDLITGLQTRTQPGRPDFDKLFAQISQRTKGGKVKVFFCGSPLLGKTVKHYSHKYNFGFSQETF